MEGSRPSVSLSNLEPGDEAVVRCVSAGPAIRQRLMEMGFVRGQRVRVEKLAPLGDPMELVVKGYHLSVRRSECACVEVELVTPRSEAPPASNGRES